MGVGTDQARDNASTGLSLAAIRSRCGRWDNAYPVSKLRNGGEWADQLRHDCGELLAEVERLREQRDALLSALNRTEQNFVAVVRSRPVRDMGETLAENDAARALLDDPTEACQHRSRARVGPRGDGTWVCNDCGYRNER